MIVRRPRDRGDREEAERWFLAHGLPWFVDAEAERVAGLLRRRPRRRALAGVVAAGLLVGALVGALAAWGSDGAPVADGVSAGVPAALNAAVLALAGYGAVSLSLDEVAQWAVRRTLRQLGLLLPLATRALPLLLIFTVFFFINTEVWQVASSMPPGVLWLVVLLFAALALLFLVARMPEEVERVVAEVRAEGPGGWLVATPLAAREDLLAGEPDVALGRLQRLNLLIMLVVVQAGQVLLLALTVFAFFLLFGALAIRPEVVESWLGAAGTGGALSVELLQVSVFLAAFSALYFTVSAVTDATYREQFFTQITAELTRAVGMRAAYAALRPVPGDDAAPGTGPGAQGGAESATRSDAEPRTGSGTDPDAGPGSAPGARRGDGGGGARW